MDVLLVHCKSQGSGNGVGRTQRHLFLTDVGEKGREVARRGLSTSVVPGRAEGDWLRKEMEARQWRRLGASGGKCGLFVYASTAQHPRPDTPPSEGDVGQSPLKSQQVAAGAQQTSS